jgi:hypothetical protein
VANTLAYYDTVTIAVIKSFIVQAPVFNANKWQGRLSTVDLLIKIASLVKKVNNIFKIRRN